MSITSALSSALTGLTATSRQAEAVSSNVANAATPGYARREVSLTALSLGGSGQGVAVRGITRQVNRFLMLDRSFNPAGVPFKPGSDKILVSLFDPKPRDGQQGGGADRSQQQSSQQDAAYGAGGGDMPDDEIPF